MSTHAPTRSGAVGLFFILWLLFAVAIIFNPAALDSVWNWLPGLPLFFQIVAWVLFLPVTLALWVWESDWTIWIRLVLIVAIAIVNLAMFSSTSRGADESTVVDQSGSKLHPPVGHA